MLFVTSKSTESSRVEAGGQHIIRKEGAELFLVEGAALVPLSKCKLFLKDNSDIIHCGIYVNLLRDVLKLPVVKHGGAKGALELKNR